MTAWNVQVAAGGDDADENASGVMDITDALNVTLTAGGHWAIFRLLNCPAQKGAVWNSAVWEGYVVGTGNDSPNGLVIYGEKVLDSGAPTTGTNDISGRTRTTASATWTGTDIGAGAFKSSPSIVAILQEITDQASWAAGGDISIIMDAAAGTAITFRPYEFDSSLAAKLTADYTDPGQAGTARGRMVPGMRRPHGHQGW